jgi:hypothetical protein
MTTLNRPVRRASFIEPDQVRKLMDIEGRLVIAGAYGRAYVLDSERDWLILSLKEAWESLAEKRKG